MRTDLLELIAALTTEREVVRDEAEILESLDQDWREAIVAALTAGVPALYIAQVAGISRDQVRAIRDGLP